MTASETPSPEGSSTHSSQQQHNQVHAVPAEALTCLFLTTMLIIGGFLRYINKKYGVPYTPTLFFIGLVAGKYLNESGGLFGQTVHLISNVNPHGLLQIFLPILVFEAGFNMDFHIFKKQIIPIMTLAFPCVLLNALIMMFTMKSLLNYDDTYYTWSGAFGFGSIVSCTDPIAVLALLKSLGAPKKFNVLIEGESLLNDATGLVLYQLASKIIKHQDPTVGDIIWSFTSLCVGGLILGCLIGILTTSVVKKFFNDEILVVNTTLVCGYLAFFVAEFTDTGFQISGIITLISLGLFMSAFGKTRINPESDHAVHVFWHYAVYAAETVIFLMAGIIVGVKCLDERDYIQLEDYRRLIFLFIFVTAARYIVIWVHFPLLKNHGYKTTFKEAIVLGWGGLRGAVGIAFALMVHNDSELDPKYRTIFLFDMAGTAVLTLIVNATTSGFLINKIGMTRKHPVKYRIFKNFIQEMRGELDEKFAELERDPYLRVTDWEEVRNLTGYNNFEKKITGLEVRANKADVEIKAELRDLESKLLNTSEMDEMVVESRSRYLMCLRGVYSEMFEKSQLSGDSLIVLHNSVNLCQDNVSEPLKSWGFVQNSFFKEGFIRLLKEIPFFSNYFKNIVFKNFSNSYDVVSAFVKAHEEAEELTLNFPIDEHCKMVVIEESKKNRETAQEYISSYLMSSYPEIVRSIQTKKAAFNLLEFQKALIRERCQAGLLDDKEFDDLKGDIDDSTVKLDYYNPSWKEEPVKNLLTNIFIFKFISDNHLNKFLDDSVEKTYAKNFIVARGGDKCRTLGIILKGSGTENGVKRSNIYQEKKTVGSIVSLYNLVSGVDIYETDTELIMLEIPINHIKELMQSSPELEENIWKEALNTIVKLHPKEYEPIGNLKAEEISELTDYGTLKHYSPLHVIDVSSGGFLLSGEVKEYDKEAEGMEFVKPKPESVNINGEAFTLPNEAEILERLRKMTHLRRFEKRMFFHPTEARGQIICLTKAVFLHLSKNERVEKLLEERDEERVSKYSTIMGFTSGQPQNVPQPKQTGLLGASGFAHKEAKNLFKKKDPNIIITQVSEGLK